MCAVTAGGAVEAKEPFERPLPAVATPPASSYLHRETVLLLKLRVAVSMLPLLRGIFLHRDTTNSTVIHY